MKYTIPFLLLLFVSPALYGQFEWVGDYGFSSTASGIYRTKNGQFVVTRDAENKAGFTVLDSLGEVVFNYTDDQPLSHITFIGEGRGGIFDFIELVDSTYLVIEWYYNCMEFIPGYSNLTARNFIKKYDSQWNNLPFGLSPFGPYFNPRWFGTPLTDGGIALVIPENSWVRRLTKNGEDVWSNFLPLFMNLMAYWPFPVTPWFWPLIWGFTSWTTRG